MFVFAVNSFALPVVFKTTKEIKNINGSELAELVTVDVSKYKSARVGVVLVSGQLAERGNIIQIIGVEEADQFGLAGFFIGGDNKSGSTLIENPPSKIKVMVKESGTYRIYVWAQ